MDICGLPQFVIQQVLLYLEVEDVVECNGTCKYLFEYGSQSILWRHLCIKQFIKKTKQDRHTLRSDYYRNFLLAPAAPQTTPNVKELWNICFNMRNNVGISITHSEDLANLFVNSCIALQEYDIVGVAVQSNIPSLIKIAVLKCLVKSISNPAFDPRKAQLIKGIMVPILADGFTRPKMNHEFLRTTAIILEQWDKIHLIPEFHWEKEWVEKHSSRNLHLLKIGHNLPECVSNVSKFLDGMGEHYLYNVIGCDTVFSDPLHPIEKLIENTYKQMNNSIVLLWLAQPLVDLLGSLSCVLSSPLPSTNTTSEEEVSEDAKEEVKEVVKEDEEDERERENARRHEEAQQKDDTKAVVLADQGNSNGLIGRMREDVSQQRAMEVVTRIAECFYNQLDDPSWQISYIISQICGFYAKAIPQFSNLLRTCLIGIIDSHPPAHIPPIQIKLDWAKYCVLSMTKRDETLPYPSMLPQVPDECKQAVLYEYLVRHQAEALPAWLSELIITPKTKLKYNMTTVVSRVSKFLEKKDVPLTCLAPGQINIWMNDNPSSSKNSGNMLIIKVASKKYSTMSSNKSRQVQKFSSNGNILMVLFGQQHNFCTIWNYPEGDFFFFEELSPSLEKKIQEQPPSMIPFNEILRFLKQALEKERVALVQGELFKLDLRRQMDSVHLGIIIHKLSSNHYNLAYTGPSSRHFSLLSSP